MLGLNLLDLVLDRLLFDGHEIKTAKYLFPSHSHCKIFGEYVWVTKIIRMCNLMRVANPPQLLFAFLHAFCRDEVCCYLKNTFLFTWF